MANLTPENLWDDVYKLERTDRVLAGTGGITNAPLQNLLNRTERIRELLLLLGIDIENNSIENYFQHRTEAQILDITDTINTQNKSIGKHVFDTTNNRLMIAVGPNAADLWYISDGSSSIEPV